MPKKIDSQRLSQLAGQPVEITIFDGETPEQAEDRILSEHPEAFGGGQEDFGSQLSGDIPQEFLADAEDAYSRGDTKALNRIKSAIDIFKSTQSKPLNQSQQKEQTKQGTVEDIKNALGILKNIETYDNPATSLGAYGIQNLGELLNLNPELTQYKQKQSMLLAPIARGIQGEVGNLSEFEQKAAKAFLPQGRALFSSSGRDVQLQNLFDSIKARTGRDLTEELDEEDLRAIGAKSFLGKKLRKPSSQGGQVIDLNQFIKR